MRNFGEKFASTTNEEEDNNFGESYWEIGELSVMLAEFYLFVNEVMGGNGCCGAFVV